MLRNKLSLMIAIVMVAISSLQAFSHKPETWFHVIGGNFSCEGITADLTAIKEAGYAGIQFFHGQFNGGGGAWEGIKEQVPCLSEKWEALVLHTAKECERLGLDFRMQNCPGWSMSGGPWISHDKAMRKLVYARADVVDGKVKEIEIPKQYADNDSNWQDVAYIAFPRPEGDAALPKAESKKVGNNWEFNFKEPVTVRSLEIPSPSQMCHLRCYMPDIKFKVVGINDEGEETVLREAVYPRGCWQDNVKMTIACKEFTGKKFRVEFVSSHTVNSPYVRLSSAPRLDNCEGLAGLTLRSSIQGNGDKVGVASSIKVDSIKEVKVGDTLGVGKWIILRLGHVNMKKVNAPAPKEATGWECDKLDPKGVEANFAGYIGKLNQGVLAGKLKGMIVDSWECERQSWTWKMRDYYREANGEDPLLKLPMLFGWVVESENYTTSFLRIWRKTISDLITKNYYARMAELAHEAKLDVAFETAFGDVLPGDSLKYFKYADTPMCEFWQPYSDLEGVGNPDYKPVKSCVSASHLYGKGRVAAESFTSMRLDWDENFQILKEQAVRHYARGVTHFVTHTYTHNPQVNFRKPGTSFGSFIGTPFLRGQTWWEYMPSFTKWISECGEFLERGKAVVDVLRYIGDDYMHCPKELEPFPAGYKCDYLNQDALLTRLSVKDGLLVCPDGMSYKMIWIPDGTYLSVETESKLKEIENAGGKVVRGELRDLPEAQVMYSLIDPKKPIKDIELPLVWYHRVEGDKDLYFVAANNGNFKGEVSFSLKNGERIALKLDLANAENKLLEFPCNVYNDDEVIIPTRTLALENWTLEFPQGWGADKTIKLNGLRAWKDIDELSDEAKAFSGTATYVTQFELAGNLAPNSKVMVDLGEVKDFAQVIVNGKDAGRLWSKPYKIDIANFIHKGKNELQIKVTSTWFNRLAYDVKLPMNERKTWTIWEVGRMPECLTQNAKLRRSGLIGPVTITMPKVGPLTELTPVPVSVTEHNGFVDSSLTNNVKVVRASIPGAPSATANEAYSIEIYSDSIKITAPTSQGEHWAWVTLNQLARLSDGKLPCCTIIDWPKFKWRGFMHDSGRNYLEVKHVKGILDAMSKAKMNLFHWHLTEYYGWRLESKKYPELNKDDAFYLRYIGKYYTQAEFCEIVDYAAKLGITVMPELDVPGHALAFRRAFGYKTMREEGIREKLCDLVDELCALVPADKLPMIHLGTDEARLPEEKVPPKWLEPIVNCVHANGRVVVGWTPGELAGLTKDGGVYGVRWGKPKDPGAVGVIPFMDASGMYIDTQDPFEISSVATYRKICPWNETEGERLGAITCAWHDDYAGSGYRTIVNQCVMPAIVMYGDAFWCGRESEDPKTLGRILPRAGDPQLLKAADFERRIAAQRDKVWNDSIYPFQFLEQTASRWRVTNGETGEVVATNVAQATVFMWQYATDGVEGKIKNANIGGNLFTNRTGVAILETWVNSPKNQTVGAWIGFTDFTRDHGRARSTPTPKLGQWNRFDATVEVNGHKILPPKWKKPGQEAGGDVKELLYVYELDEVAFEDEEYYMREPTPVTLKEGWNHIRIVVPMKKKAANHAPWVSTFMLLEGTTEHPRRVEGLQYSTVPQN